ncbi:G-protein-coupled receptor family 3 protein 8 [Heterostelium album PN500]|uniref:G-protein-coupled receptor family 3 protein 8 n=1 Tax=Heterostelium pallidum (strain ATCC 26659 / Pp 5 / PN500) TaxID=670386 RepID=D3BAZ6_HETP5|nr:G-protein-coupled receptor family 3 protein 8 [Heterostelium album PN500]EFA81733.1 G-protein-coupled receptor family 3 protein 8 [Heterostelium album PN500]|eukprot:XP_020433850.1 G-protein-coupled receptor family 3 protein 8 [Heterostelium album PN500]
MKLLALSIIVVILSIFCNLSIGANPVPKENFKLALILSGEFTDLGYNYACNQALINVEKALRIHNQTTVFNNIVTYEDTVVLIKKLVKQQYNLIIGSSIEHVQATQDMSAVYPDTYFLIRGLAVPTAKNVRNIFIDFGIGHYLIGYLAAMASTTKKIGIVVPGPPSLSYVTANAYYLGAMNYSKDITVYSAETGSWYNPVIEVGATNYLIDKGVDVVAMSADDLSVQSTAISRGALSFGTSGYPVYNIFGESILTSIITNWTMAYLNASQDIIAGTFQSELYYGTLTDGGVFLDQQYSYLLKKEQLDQFNTLTTALKATKFEDLPYAYNKLYLNSSYGKERLDQNDLLSSPTLLPEIIDLGYYVIPPNEYVVKKSITYGFSIAAGVVGLVAVIILVGLLVFRETKIMRSASPLFCMLIVFGGILIYVAVILWVQSPTTGLCRSRIWLMSLGYTIMLGNMVIKNFRIWLIFDNPLLKKLRITNAKLMPWLGGIILLNCLILAIMTGVGEVHSQRNYGFEGLFEYDYRVTCDMNKSGNIVLYILLIYHAILLLVGCFVSWKIRIVDIAEFNESKSIANTLYAISFCLFIIIPLMVSQTTYDSQIIIICASAIFTTASTLTILFLPKFWRLYTKGVNADPFSSTSQQMSFDKSVGGQTKGPVEMDTVIVSQNEPVSNVVDNEVPSQP